MRKAGRSSIGMMVFFGVYIFSKSVLPDSWQVAQSSIAMLIVVIPLIYTSNENGSQSQRVTVIIHSLRPD